MSGPAYYLVFGKQAVMERDRGRERGREGGLEREAERRMEPVSDWEPKSGFFHSASTEMMHNFTVCPLIAAINIS